VAKWDGQAWTPLPGDTDRPISVIEVFDDGSGPRLYVGGNFARAGGVEATRVAQWDGSSWSAVGSGTSGVVRAMADIVLDAARCRGDQREGSGGGERSAARFHSGLLHCRGPLYRRRRIAGPAARATRPP